MSPTKTARWNGPFIAQAVNGRLLHPGDEMQVSEADLLSSHWQEVKPPDPAPAPVETRSKPAADKPAQEASA